MPNGFNKVNNKLARVGTVSESIVTDMHESSTARDLVGTVSMVLKINRIH